MFVVEYFPTVKTKTLHVGNRFLKTIVFSIRAFLFFWNKLSNNDFSNRQYADTLFLFVKTYSPTVYRLRAS